MQPQFFRYTLITSFKNKWSDSGNGFGPEWQYKNFKRYKYKYLLGRPPSSKPVATDILDSFSLQMQLI